MQQQLRPFCTKLSPLKSYLKCCQASITSEWYLTYRHAQQGLVWKQRLMVALKMNTKSQLQRKLKTWEIGKWETHEKCF